MPHLTGGPELLLLNVLAGCALVLLAIAVFAVVRARLRGHPWLQTAIVFGSMPLLVVAGGWLLFAGMPTPVSLEGAWIWPGVVLLAATAVAAAAED